MSKTRLETWQRLIDPAQAELVTAAAGVDATDVAAVSRLRARWDADLVAGALELAKARRKAAAKFGEDAAHTLVADAVGVEMATSSLAGMHKAQRFVRRLGAGASVVDLCCGVGGDLMALTSAGLDAVGVDLDPCRAWMAGRNAHAETRCADVLDETLPSGAFHLDPARRQEAGSRKRVFRYEDLRPGPEIIERLIAQRSHGGVKLGPGVDFSSLPMDDGTSRAEVELISEDGRLTQAVLWTGDLAEAKPGERTATALRSDGASRTIRGVPSDGPHDAHLGQLGEFLFEPDPAAERGRLLGTLCERFGVREFCPGLGLLTADTNPCEADSEARVWLGGGRCGFRVLAQMPWREKKVAAWLREQGCGVEEIKTRGKAVDPDEVRRVLLKLAKDSPIEGVNDRASLFIIRLGEQKVAVIARRLGARDNTLKVVEPSHP